MPILIVIIGWGYMIVKTFLSLKEDKNKEIVSYLSIALIVEIGIFVFMTKWLIESYLNI